MGMIVSARRLVPVAACALCLTLLSSAAARGEPRTWDLTSDFPLGELNPAPDKYGHKAIWTFMYSNLKKPGAYSRLSQFYGPAIQESTCGVKDFYFWNKSKNAPTATPAVFFNAGETVELGANKCNPSTVYPGHTVFMHPQLLGADAAVRWKSTVSATVIITGTVQAIDPNLTGIKWELDRGTTAVAGPIETHENNSMSFGPTAVPIVKGEFLYLRVGHASDANGASDTTAVSLTIKSP